MKGWAGAVRRGSIYAIMGLILFVIVLVTVGLFLTLAQTLLAGHYNLDKGEILSFFGELLLVVIGVELFDTIKGLLIDSRVKAEMVLLVGVTAVSRELIVFNYEGADGVMLAGLGVLIAAAATAYYLIRRTILKEGASGGDP
jgi:uncharacterized membrane protein (DUF373 family)